MKKVRYHANEIKKCKDVSHLRDLPGRKIILTNSLKSFAKPILRHLKLKKYFAEIYGAEDFDDKGDFLKDYIKKKKLQKKDCYYIGDRVKDVKVAKGAGIKSIIIISTCSWDPKKEILKSKPDFILNNIKDISEILKKINLPKTTAQTH